MTNASPCPQCGRVNLENAKFCTRCGALVGIPAPKFSSPRPRSALRLRPRLFWVVVLAGVGFSIHSASRHMTVPPARLDVPPPVIDRNYFQTVDPPRTGPRDDRDIRRNDDPRRNW